MEHKGAILLVGKATQFASILTEQFQIQTVEERWLATQAVLTPAPELIVLYAQAGDKSVLDWLAVIGTSNSLSYIPVFVLAGQADPTLEVAVFQAGACDYLTVPFEPEVLVWRMVRCICSYRWQQEMLSAASDKEKEMERLSLRILSAIANLVDSKDRYLKGHSIRVAGYARAIAQKLHKSDKEQRDLYYMGMLHDIGKIGIPDTILTKPDRLTDLEYSLVKQHTAVGQELLKDITRIPHAAMVAAYHHERCDGTGYMSGLKNDEIPLDAKIINIADAVDAMSTDRAYRNRLTREEIRQELLRGRDTQFDAQLVDIMLELLQEGFQAKVEDAEIDAESVSLAEEGNALLQRLLMEYTEEIKDAAQRDSLTGLWNRWHLESQVNTFLRSGRHTGSFFMMDLDNFKLVNDTWGHLAGDRLLIDFAALLQAFSREEDIVCRFGGDEFAVFFKDLNDVEILTHKAEMYMELLQEKLLKVSGYDGVSLSVGIAIAPWDGKTFGELYEKADKALYHVKYHGKNGYQFYEDSMESNEMR